MTISDLLALLAAIGTDSKTVIDLLKPYSPDQQITSILNLSELLIPLLTGLASKGVAAYQGASGTPITVASVTALLPDSTPLPPPTE